MICHPDWDTFENGRGATIRYNGTLGVDQNNKIPSDLIAWGLILGNLEQIIPPL